MQVRAAHKMSPQNIFKHKKSYIINTTTPLHETVEHIYTSQIHAHICHLHSCQLGSLRPPMGYDSIPPLDKLTLGEYTCPQQR